MGGFKLIGIRPHKDCGKQYLKLLEPGRLYQFYNEYEFFTEDRKFDGVNGNITHFSINKNVPDDLYKIGELDINISAVVGKNGTGKSTLIELLLYCIYYLGLGLGDSNDSEILKPYHTRLEEEERLLKEKKSSLNENNKKLEDYVKCCIIDRSKKSKDPDYKLIEQLKSKIEELFNSKDTLDKLEKDLSLYKELIKLSKESNDVLLEEFKCSVLYDLNGILIELNINTPVEDKSNITFKIIKNNTFNEPIEISRNLKIDSLLYPESYELLRNFFYSVFLNYSHHSLNSNYIGDWVITLFHKNDGYKTPAVINPMREEGNIYINNEINLSKNRLLTNLLIKRFIERKSKDKLKGKAQVTEKQYVKYVSFHFDKMKHQKDQIKLGNKKSGRKEDAFLIGGETNLITDLLNVHYKIFHRYDSNDYLSRDYQYMEPLLDYIVYKVKRILKNYPEYYSPVSSKEDEIFHAYKNSIENLKDDNSHVTFKYHRVIHFLGKILDKETQLWGKEGETIYFKLDDLLDWMNIRNEKDLYEINRRLPPPIFDVDFIFESKLENFELTEENKTSKPKFSDLSSGEQQSIHSINSLIYHLNNAYSVHNKNGGVERIQYNYFNVVFDEIELYFHPDLQRRFINDLLNTLGNYKYLFQNEIVKGINILFSTHSPFILSDIPEQNILQLEYGLSDLTQDNNEYSIPVIHKNQTFGANIFDLLTDNFYLKDGSIGEFARSKIQLVIDNLLDEKDENYKSPKIVLEKESIKEFINIISEPFFKEKLMVMYYKKFDKEFRKQQLLNELNELEE